MNIKTVILALVGIGLCVGLAVQRKMLASLQDANRSQQEHLGQLSVTNYELSQHAVQDPARESPPIEWSSEVLRLRGQVGVLTRELQEARAQAAPTSITQLRSRAKALSLRLKTLSEQLERGESAAEDILQAMESSGVRDPAIDSWSQMKQQIGTRIGVGVTESERTKLEEQASDLQSKIDTRLRGLFAAFSASLDSTDRLLDDRQPSLGSMDAIERLLNSAEQLSTKR